MSLQVPTFANPYSTTPITNAYAWIGVLNLDFVSMTGRVEVRVNTDAESASQGLPPVSVVSFPIGTVSSVGPQGAAPLFPSLPQILTDNQASFDEIRTYLYEKVTTDSRFAGSTQVD